MRHYADSSFLVSCYIADANTPQAKIYLTRTGVPLVFTAPHALEVKNALRLGIFRQLLTASDADAAWTNLQKDLRTGRLVKTTVPWPSVFLIATRLSEQHSSRIGTRSLDVLHVAAAKAIQAEEFVSFDSRQSALAKAIGLTVLP